MPVIHVQELVKRYTPRGPNAVDGISFEVHTGEIFSLLGPNGAGKTTTIAMLSTLIPPTSGDAFICGHSIRKDPMAVRRSIGVVPQSIALYDELSALENLHFWGAMRGLTGAMLKHQVQAALERTGLVERGKDRVRTFSGGMKRRLNIAVGLLGEPKVLMLDEPTVGVDPQSRRYILDWIRDLSQQGMTVLYTTHYMEEAQELSHRIGIIDHGKLIAQGALHELRRIIGDHKQLSLQFTTDTGAQALAAELNCLPGLSKLHANGSHMTLTIESLEATLPLILNKAAGLGMSIRAIEICEPNLETVFLQLTGRALRDHEGS